MTSKNEIVATASGAVAKLQARSPKLMFVAGIGAVLGGTVLACRATLKVDAAMTEAREDLAVARDENEQLSLLDGEKGKSVSKVYVKHGAKIVRMYAPAIVTTGAGIALLTGSHVVLSNRNAKLTAAYSALDQAYRLYRERVAEEVGEEREVELYRGLRQEEVVGEDGKKTKVTTADVAKSSPYAQWFCESSRQWQDNAEVNRLFLTAQENYANQLLQSRGHIFLNEVHDLLDIPHTKAGSVVGWHWDPDNEDIDNYVSFGIMDCRNSEFLNGTERSILLDFNVDGVIYDKLG